jgi:hypothetical protein
MNRRLNQQGNYLFFVKDISVFPGYLETFFKWRYFLFFELKLKSFKKYTARRGLKVANRYLLQDLGLKIRL